MSRTRSKTILTSELKSGGFSRYYVSDTVNHGLRLQSEKEKFYSTPSETQTTTDVVTPNYSKRISAGEIINNPFESVRIKNTFPQTVPYYHYYGGKYQHLCEAHQVLEPSAHKFEGVVTPTQYDYIDVDWSTLNTNRDAVISAAVTSAHANIDTSEILALATAAESRKTVDSMVSIMRRTAKIAKNLRKFNIRSLRNELHPRELADRYMEARYAIRPLIYDAYGVAAAFQAERNSKIRRTFRGFEEESASISDTVETNSFGVLTQAKWDRSARCTISARAGVLCDVNLTTVSVLGVNQPFESMWELTPFSFIIDWFANVGDTIAAWTPNAGVQQRASWVTVRETRTLTNTLVSCRSTALTDGHTFGDANCGTMSHQREDVLVDRIVEPALSTWPQSNMRLDMFKITDLGIILRGLTR